MRTVVAYTSARILMLVVTFFVLYLCGVRSLIVLLAVSFFVSAIASYILLAKQRERVAGALNHRLGKATSKVTGKAAEFKERLEEGAAAEDSPARDSLAKDAGKSPAGNTRPAGNAQPAGNTSQPAR
ncbi:MAG: DUF4229 domain-containing protein [Nocardiopsaceae bacterium]|nr:DUF4229 domain-containing protein [Nocardiopsaceae bacterium]